MEQSIFLEGTVYLCVIVPHGQRAMNLLIVSMSMV